MTAATYARISKDDEKIGAGVAFQTAQLLAAAEVRGDEVPVDFRLCDNDKSAFRAGVVREDFDRLLDLIAHDKVQTVYIREFSRLNRNMSAHVRYCELAEAHGVTTVTLMQGVFEPHRHSDADVMFHGWMARDEAKKISQRSGPKLEALADAGRRMGRQRVYGWDGHAVVEEQAVVVREITSRVIAGESSRSIARSLNERGIPSPRDAQAIMRSQTPPGIEWSGPTVTGIAQRAANAGLQPYRGKAERGVRGAWPAIVTEEEWAAAKQALTAKERRTATTNVRKHLLTGLLRCGVCEAPMRISGHKNRDGSNKIIYRCQVKGDHSVTKTVTSMDRYVTKVVLARLARDDARELLTDGSDEAARAQVEAASLRGRLDAATSAYAAGELTLETLKAVTSKLEAQIEDAESRAARRHDAEVFSDLVGREDAEQYWSSLDLSRQRSIIAALMTVYALPAAGLGRGFHPDAVRVEWRVGASADAV